MKLFNIICVGVNKRFDTRRMGQFLATLVLLLLFHTQFVLTVCPENCLSCTDQNNCTKCKANKWRTGVSQCFQDCSKDCLNGECHDDTGYCLNCEHGKYGRWCQYNCSDCKNENCNLYQCVEGCKSGYFEYQTSNDNLCQECPRNCGQCDNGIVCRICNDGFYLNKYYYIGNTIVNCVPCLNENECSNFCFIEGCKLCKLINNKPVCADCPEGETFNGVSCEQNGTRCSQGCSTNCSINVICVGNCNVGWTGERCTEKCNEKCLICSKNDRNICIQCNGNFYSDDCSLACSKSCKLEDGKSTCTLDDGYCINGCKQCYWGETCNNSCPENCKDHDCERSTGICTGGCKEGFSGDNCVNQEETPVTIETTSTSMKATLNTTTPCTQNQASEDKIIFTIIGFFSGIGFSLVIVAIVKLLYYIRRRYFEIKQLKITAETLRFQHILKLQITTKV